MAPLKKTQPLKPSRVAFQGEPGAFSDLACLAVFPKAKTLPCPTFEDAFAALAAGKVQAAMIPIENAIAGRVADVHHLMAQMKGMHIVAEHFQPIAFCLMGTKNSKIKDLTHVHSHSMALPQCRKQIRALGLKEVVHQDTAGAASMVAALGNSSQAAVASELAAKINGLKILKRDMQNTANNYTRFVVFSKKDLIPSEDTRCITSFFFTGQNIPAFLYKALGAFATNRINVIKIESYVEDFRAAHFYCEVEGHPNHRGMQLAFDELKFYTKGNIRIMGTYPADAFRKPKK